MAVKEIIGIALEGDRIRAARLEVHKNHLELLEIDSFQLAKPLEVAETPQKNQGETKPESESDEDLFNLDAGDTGTDEDPLNFDFEDEEEKEGADLDFDMTEEGSSGNEESDNESLLSLMLSNFDEKNVKLALNVPAGKTMLQFFHDTDYRELKKKDIQDFIQDKLGNIYNKSIPDDQFRYYIREDGSLALASFENPSELLNLVDHAAPVYKGKIRIQDIVPDELNLVGLIRSNYDLVEDEYTGIIHISKEFTRVLFMKGREVHIVLPVINVNSNSRKALDTIFSKILFEIDKGDIPNINRLIITNPSGFDDEARAYFAEQFLDISVENFQYDGDKFAFSEELEKSPPNLKGFSCAIAAAWAASGIDKEDFLPISFLPKYVSDRQQVFKLQWHGVVLLMIIAAIPFILNTVYQRGQDTIQALQLDNRQLRSQIQQVQPTAQIVEYLTAELGPIMQEQELMQEQSSGTLKWVRSLDILNNGMNPVRNTWLTSLQSVNDGFIINGYSIYRDRIPQVARIFHRATISQVNEGEIRDQKVYRFTILVHEITDETSRFDPVFPPARDEIIRKIKEDAGLVFEDGAIY